MSQQPNFPQPLDSRGLGDLPVEIFLFIAKALSFRDRYKLHQTCRSIYSLLRNDIIEERARLVAHALAPKQEYEELNWHWREPDPIAGRAVPMHTFWNEPPQFLDRPRESEGFACAIFRGDIEAMQDYLCAGFDPNAYSLTGGFMLHIAARSNQPEIVTLLLKHGADPAHPDFRDGSQPYEAHLVNDTAVILAFARSNNHARIHGLASYIISRCSFETVQACIDLGMDWNGTDRRGRTAAHCLAHRNQPELFDLVAPHLTMETMTMVSRANQRPLTIALYNPSPDIAMRFIDAGADLNPIDEWNNTVLWTAIKRRHFGIAYSLLDKNAFAPLASYIGGRELHAAISAGKHEIIQTLINRGVSKEQDERDDFSPLICAIRTGNLTILKLFYEEGPKPSLVHNPGTLFSHSAYSLALLLRKREIADYLEVCIDRDGGSSPQLPESDSYANMARNIMETMSNIYQWNRPSSSSTRIEVYRPEPVKQIALHILPLAGANFDSDRTRKLVKQAQHISPAIHAVCGEEEDRAGLLEKALPRLVRTIREEANPEKRILFLETLEVVINSHILSQIKIQMSAYKNKHKLTHVHPISHPGIDSRQCALNRALGRLWYLARENTDNDEMDRVMTVILRLLRF
ncbi:Cyclin-like F-box [Penicillium camemberti]|uniref:Cyclin-like F-box n=1 Tax=Penicillium camemberti (strain FM 013) TaxID=1429867 RepID=A0A0G4PHE4_PENC3|nr:Cyclin-like F-box [Penicillium camemberti]